MVNESRPHPGIVHADSLVQLDGRWTLAMEHILGVSLADIIRCVGLPFLGGSLGLGFLLHPDGEAPASTPPPTEAPSSTKSVRKTATASNAPASSTPPPSTGRVVVKGGAEDVRFVRGADKYPPGDVPAGSYAIEARFPAHGLVSAGRISVVAGQTVSLTCDPSFAMCRGG